MIYIMFSLILIILYIKSFNYTNKIILSDTYEVPKILGINLKNNTERYMSLSRDFKNYNLERFNAVKRKVGYEGCALSHISCVELARSRGYPWVIIIEDDCLLKTDLKYFFNDILHHFFSFIVIS